MKRIRKYEIYSISLILFVSLFVLNSIYAQEPTLISNTDTNITADQIKESVRTVAETVDQIRVEAVVAEDEIRAEVKAGIDKNIIEIRKESGTPAYELQKAVDNDRLELFESLNSTLNNININNSSSLEKYTDMVDSKVSDIEKALQDKSGLITDFSQERRSIRNTLLKLQRTIEEKKQIIENKEGEMVYEDTDKDGVSDYDEKYIYDSDPNNPSTSGDGESDGSKISSGKNPKTGENISYQNPQEDVTSYVTSAYKLESVTLVKQESKDLIRFEGRALPNSFVTLYIYSTPIIVTVKTNENGDWNYELDKELENGEHQLYVATVNNSGKIIARSNPISFTKTAEAASIGIVGIDVETSKAGDFFRDNFILISLAILIGIVVLALMLIGKTKDVKSVVADLKNEVEKKDKIK